MVKNLPDLSQVTKTHGRALEILLNTLCAMEKGSRIVIYEICPDENREKDLFPLLFGVNMLIHTTEGNTFSISGYTSWLHNAGFKKVETIDIPANSPLIIGIK